MSVSRELEVGKWIKAQLAEQNSDVNSYLDLIPEGDDLPAFRFQCQMRSDNQTVAGHIATSRYKFLVVATVQGLKIGSGPNGLVSLAEDIDAALHLANGQTDKARIGACTRVETYGMTEQIGSDTFRHAGAIFEIIAYGLPESE